MPTWYAITNEESRWYGEYVITLVMPDGRVLIPAIYAHDTVDSEWMMYYCKSETNSVPPAYFLSQFYSNQEGFGNDSTPFDGGDEPPVDLRDILGVITDDVSTLWLGEVGYSDSLASMKAVFAEVQNYVEE